MKDKTCCFEPGVLPSRQGDYCEFGVHWTVGSLCKYLVATPYSRGELCLRKAEVMNARVVIRIGTPS